MTSRFEDCLLTDIRRLVNKIQETERLGRVRTIGDALATYAHDERIDALFFVDESARCAYIPFQESWKRLFPGEQIPDRYFTNPKAYKTSGWGATGGFTFSWRTKQAELFTSTYKRLKQDDRILIFDTCMHSGKTMNKIINTMSDAGFSHVSVALAQAPSKNEHTCKVDYACLQDDIGCYPFGYGLGGIDTHSFTPFLSRALPEWNGQELVKLDARRLRLEYFRSYRR